MTIPVRDGHVTQDYGVPGNYSAGYHTGRDYAGGSTNDILATRAGIVTRVSYDGDYGNRVEILTDGIEHSYSHMAYIIVSVNQKVSQGQYLGEMGNTGNSKGKHCHYEERTSPHGYNDHRRPIWDTTNDESEELEVAANLITFFQRKGTIYEANLAAGTYHPIANPQDLTDRKHVLTKSGIPWFEWAPGKDVENPEAFGIYIHP